MTRILLTSILLLQLIIGCQPADKKGVEVETNDFFIESTDGVQIFVREFMVTQENRISESPLILIHGGGPGSIASFDLDVHNG